VQNLRIPAWLTLQRASTVVALVTGVCALIFTLWPNVKPFEVTTKRATVLVSTVDRGVTRDQWRWRESLGDARRHADLVSTDAKTLKMAEAEACTALGGESGYVAVVTTAAEGFKRKSLIVRAWLYSYPARQRIEKTQNEEFRELAKVPIDAPTAESVEEIWAYDPGASRRYYIRVGLYDGGGQLLAVADSRPFNALSQKELSALSEATPRGCS
jgi:hypothetical protein